MSERLDELKVYFVQLRCDVGDVYLPQYNRTMGEALNDTAAVLVFATDQQDAEDIATHHFGTCWERVGTLSEYCLNRYFLRERPGGMVVIPPNFDHQMKAEPCKCVACGEVLSTGEYITMLDSESKKWGFPVLVDSGFQDRYRRDPDDNKRVHKDCLDRLVKTGLIDQGDIL